MAVEETKVLYRHEWPTTAQTWQKQAQTRRLLLSLHGPQINIYYLLRLLYEQLASVRQEEHLRTLSHKSPRQTNPRLFYHTNLAINYRSVSTALLHHSILQLIRVYRAAFFFICAVCFNVFKLFHFRHPTAATTSTVT